MVKDFKYSAFISYSHADQKIVQWLHRALERYHLPKHLIGIETPEGVVSEKMKPFFRDRDDMAASTDLGETVQQAMKQSKFLIVICSPSAVKSKWVHQEILEFKKFRENGKILCLIVAGEPNASTTSGGDVLECFPSALKENLGGKKFEPIAADARPEGDGKQLAKLKLISGMLGIDLDKLVQRDAQRKQRRQIVGMASSLAGVAVLAILLVLAVVARKSAEDARFDSEEKRDQAEFLVEYLLEDLTTNIEQTEKLEVMEDIAMQALGYYAALDIEDVDADILSRRAQILLKLGSIEKMRGNIVEAKAIFQQAFLITEELLAQDPDNVQRVFDHSQSIFWIAALDLQQGNFDEAETQLQLYADFANRLLELEPENQDWQIEMGYAHSNLGTLYHDRGMFDRAEKKFAEQLKIFQTLSDDDPDSIELKYEVAQSLAWYSDAFYSQGKLEAAKELRQRELEIYQELVEQNPQNNIAKEAMLTTHRLLGLINYYQGSIEVAARHYEAGISINKELIAFDSENTDLIIRFVFLNLDYLEFLGNYPGPYNKTNQLDLTKRLAESLIQKDNTNTNWLVANYSTLLVEAKILLETGQVEKALKIAETANEGLLTLWQKNPDLFDVLGVLGLAAQVFTDGLELNGQPENATIILQNFIKIAEPFENRLSIRGQDFLARAWLRTGSFEKANQKKEFFDSIGYRNPDINHFWEKWGK